MFNMEKQNYKKISNNLLKKLDERSRYIILRRFNLKNDDDNFLMRKNGKGDTLEAIGKDYGITRERVRQIEKEIISFLKKEAVKNYKNIFKNFEFVLSSFGGVKDEQNFFSLLSGNKNYSYLFFLLSLSDVLKRYNEDNFYNPFWIEDYKRIKLVQKGINIIVNKIKKSNKLFEKKDLYNACRAEFLKLFPRHNKEIFNSCLAISKKIEKNIEDKIGLSEWIEVNPKGIRDRAYLALRKAGSPLHFSQVASLIENFFEVKAHTATVHNELIKDDRFVLIGRGMYALKEWGYEPGVIKDIILKILSNSKNPLKKEVIVKEVLKQRFVKPSTIFLNLKNKNYFIEDQKGRYTIKEA